MNTLPSVALSDIRNLHHCTAFGAVRGRNRGTLSASRTAVVCVRTECFISVFVGVRFLLSDFYPVRVTLGTIPRANCSLGEFVSGTVCTKTSGTQAQGIATQDISQFCYFDFHNVTPLFFQVVLSSAETAPRGLCRFLVEARRYEKRSHSRCTFFVYVRRG